jgi:hypothetical protein
MPRIILAIALVALLGVAIAVPAMAQTLPARVLNIILPTLAQAPLLSDLWGSSDNNEEIIEPIVFSNSERPEIYSSSSLNPNNSISINSNTSDTNTSNLEPAASQEFSERRIQSGKASPSFSVNNTGENANICPAGQQVVNTGNVANQQGVVQYNSTGDDIDLTGSSITVDGYVSAECTQSIEQAGATGK